MCFRFLFFQVVRDAIALLNLSFRTSSLFDVLESPSMLLPLCTFPLIDIFQMVNPALFMLSTIKTDCLLPFAQVVSYSINFLFFVSWSVFIATFTAGKLLGFISHTGGIVRLVVRHWPTCFHSSGGKWSFNTRPNYWIWTVAFYFSVGMYILTSNINVSDERTVMSVFVAESVLYYQVSPLHHHLKSYYIFQKSRPATTWSRFQIEFDWSFLWCLKHGGSRLTISLSCVMC